VLVITLKSVNVLKFILYIFVLTIKMLWILNDLNEIMALIMSSALMSRLFSLSKGLGAFIRVGAFIRNFTVI
jgi:hypothetical protein